MESEVFEPAGSHPIRGAGFCIGTDCRRAPRCASFCEVADSVNTRRVPPLEPVALRSRIG
jgi:hypothetical protein